MGDLAHTVWVEVLTEGEGYRLLSAIGCLQPESDGLCLLIAASGFKINAELYLSQRGPMTDNTWNWW